MLELDRESRWELADLADREIVATLRGERDAPPAQDRWEALGVTVSSAFPLAAEAWRPAMARLGLRARLVGAFSLGAPQVQFISEGRLRRCSLADVLLVVDDLRPGKTDRQALLVRTRATDDPVQAADPASELYRTWPTFRFCAEPARPHVLPAGDDPASEPAAFVTYDPRSHSGWQACGASVGGASTATGLGGMLVRLARGAVGRPATRGGQDAWSAIVDELLTRTIRVTLGGILSSSAGPRTATTVAGPAGTGHVIVDNTSGRPIESVVGTFGAEGPLSVVHLCVDAPP